MTFYCSFAVKKKKTCSVCCSSQYVYGEEMEEKRKDKLKNFHELCCGFHSPAGGVLFLLKPACIVGERIKKKKRKSVHESYWAFRPPTQKYPLRHGRPGTTNGFEGSESTANGDFHREEHLGVWSVGGSWHCSVLPSIVGWHLALGWVLGHSWCYLAL